LLFNFFFFIFHAPATLVLEAKLNILFLVSSLKKYDGRIISPVVEQIARHGSVTIIETELRTELDSQHAVVGRQNSRESGVKLKRAKPASSGFYLNVRDEGEKTIGSLHEYFVQEIRKVDCVIADLTIGCPQMGYLIGQAITEWKPVLCFVQRFSFVQRTQFDLFRNIDDIDVVEFNSEDELDGIFQRFTARVRLSHAV